MEKYVFGGYVQTGGKFDDGREWSGVVVMLAPLFKDATKPNTAKVYKGRSTLIDVVRQLTPGQIVAPVCDMTGRIVGINVVE